MKEYIEREALIAEFKRLTFGENSLIERVFADGVYAVLETFPAADVRYAIHSKWEITEVDHAHGDKCYHCPECGHDEWRYEETNFCPNCGADMREVTPNDHP